MAGEMKASPRFGLMGLFADALKGAQSGMNRIDLPYVGGLGDLMLGGAPQLADDISYQGLSGLMRGGNVATGGIGTYTLKPEVLDLAGVVTGLGGLARPVANAAGRAALPMAREFVGQVGARNMSGMPMARGQIGALYPEEMLSGNPYFIRDEADSLAEMLKQKGFQVQVEHSGSAAGPSSYLKVYDPLTGRVVADNLRLSAHSKGAYNSTLIQNINREQFPEILEYADSVRQMGKSDTMLKQEQLDEIAQKLIQQGKKPQSAYKEARRQINGD
jgi:hypothetical protein